jgi:hypothetical protein
LIRIGKTNLGSLRNGVLGKLTGKDEADGSLDLTGGDGGFLVVSGKLGSLGRNTLENIWVAKLASRSKNEGWKSGSHTIDERVENRHRTVGDTSVRVNLLQNLVDVGRVGLLPGLGTLLLLTAGRGSLLASIL